MVEPESRGPNIGLINCRNKKARKTRSIAREARFVAYSAHQRYDILVKEQSAL